MKKHFFLIPLMALLSTPAFPAKWPAPVGYVNDYAHVIPADQVQGLEDFLTQVEQKTGAQITVVTVPSVEGGDIDGAAVDLFKAWGVGRKGKDDGLLLLAAIQDRKARIEVGYGLEGVITDGDAGSVLRHEVFPFFKQGDYGQGLVNGAYVLAQQIAQSKGVSLGGPASTTLPGGEDGGRLGFWATIALFLFVFSLLSFLNRRSRGGFWGGGFYGGGWGGGGFGGGGFGGGGFGGFGGGGSGGGGASGGW